MLGSPRFDSGGPYGVRYVAAESEVGSHSRIVPPLVPILYQSQETQTRYSTLRPALGRGGYQPDVVVEVEEVVGVVTPLERGEPGQLARAVRAADARLALVGEGRSRTRRWRRARSLRPSAAQRRILSPRPPPGLPRRRHELDQRIAVAGCRLVLAHLGDRAAVALEAAVREQLGIAVAGLSACQERLDRVVGELTEVVALPVAPQPLAVLGVVDGLQLEVGQLLDPLSQRWGQSRSACSNSRPLSGSPT